MTGKPSKDNSELAVGQKVQCSLDGSTLLGEVYKPPSEGIVSVRFHDGCSVGDIKDLKTSDVRIAAFKGNERVYIERDERWEMGRIVCDLPSMDPDSALRRYQVRFPKKDSRQLTEDAFHVDSGRKNPDPFDTLIARGMETPFFYEHRSRFIQALTQQRAAGRGLTGLLSSRIRFYPHQIEVIRRVLQDPRQRYLLADEVGLGKTIETGVIIRQLSLDDPSIRVVVLAPQGLIPQWQEELNLRFALKASPNDDARVRLQPHDANLDTLAPPEVLIVDEAHKLVAGWNTGNSSNWSSLHKLAKRTPRILLLTATPVIGHEQELLKLLSILEPDLYSPEELSDFRKRIEHRKELAPLLMALQPDQASFALRQSAESIAALFRGNGAGSTFNDPRAVELAEHLREVAKNKELHGEIRSAVRQLKAYISEGYRLHRRMIRNRRLNVPEDYLSERREPDLTLESDGTRKSAIWKAFENWRDHVAFRCQQGGPSLITKFLPVFEELTQSVGSWSGWSSMLVKYRLGRDSTGKQDLESFSRVRSVELLEGEKEYLERLLKELEKDKADDRISLLREILKRKKAGMKTVVFTGSTTVCIAIAGQFHKAFKKYAYLHRGLSPQEAEGQLQHFTEDSDCRFLVCDTAGQEGRNLQFADYLIHFDLPFDPFAIEQRIGRLDRLGREAPIPSTVILCDDKGQGLDEAWKEVLEDGFRVFCESISDQHLLVQRVMPELLREALLKGPQGLRDKISQVKEKVQQERDRMAEQDLIDSDDYEDESSHVIFESLKSYEEDSAFFREVVEGYLKDVNRIYLPKLQKTLPSRIRDYFDQEDVLLPYEWFESIARDLQRPLCFDRDHALDRTEAEFLRLGHPLVDRLHQFALKDDRGRAYALWRTVRGWPKDWVGFCFDYIVEPDGDRLAKALGDRVTSDGERQALLRQAEFLCPPFYKRFVVDEGGEVVNDPTLLKHVSRIYDKKYGDHNLGSDEKVKVITNVIGLDAWTRMCERARKTAEASVRESEEFEGLCHKAGELASDYASRRLGELKAHARYQAAIGKDVTGLLDREEMMLAAVRECVVRPRLDLDSVGFFVLSGSPCP